MKPQALFKLLVVGGALLGMSQACGNGSIDGTGEPSSGGVSASTRKTVDGGTNDGGDTGQETGGGVPGW